MKLHCLKIKAEYANAKLDGDKMFEIRLNDRRPFVYYSGNLRMLGSAMGDQKIKNRTLGEMGVLIVEAVEEGILQIIVNDAWTRL